MPRCGQKACLNTWGGLLERRKIFIRFLDIFEQYHIRCAIENWLVKVRSIRLALIQQEFFLSTLSLMRLVEAAHNKSTSFALKTWNRHSKLLAMVEELCAEAED